MKRSISEIKKHQDETHEHIRSFTYKYFKTHIDYCNQQYNLFQEFLTNYYEYGIVHHKDPNQFIPCFSLLSDMLRKEKICLFLIENGYYDETAELVRHMMQSCFTIIYIANNKDGWKEWFLYQKYEQDKLVKKYFIPLNIINLEYYIKLISLFKTYGFTVCEYNPKLPQYIYLGEYKQGYDVAINKKPKNSFSKRYEDFLELNGEKDYYPFYQLLCSWSHPSIEAMRSDLELNHSGTQKYFFTRRYNSEKAEYLLNTIFGFINKSIWGGFNKIIAFDSIPDILTTYKDIQEKATKTFDKFYK